MFCKVINLAAGSVGGAGQASGWVSVQECHVAWGAEAPVRTLDFIIVTCVTDGHMPISTDHVADPEGKGFPRSNLGVPGREGSSHATRPRSLGGIDRKCMSGISVLQAPGGRRSRLSLVAGGP